MITVVAALALAASPPPRVVVGRCQPCADLKEINATVLGVYDVISGPPGQKRDFARMRSLFAQGATMKAIGPKGLRGGSVEDYIARNQAVLEKEGFTERELQRRTQLWGGLATVWSAYDGRTANGSFHERGINSFQLVKVDGKWLVASILWQEETPDNPLPPVLKGELK
ncbi:MAG: nuclear transport factor 2 family protein [Mesorhizobium sp.]|nr:nuclear transport factor 2 family protein [Mesorhizobium sp.]